MATEFFPRSPKSNEHAPPASPVLGADLNRLVAELVEARLIPGMSTAPRTGPEHSLAAIWREVLGREHIGVHDNFFALGGHSLGALRMISRVRDRFQRELSLERVFEFPTIASLAIYLSGENGAPTTTTPGPLTPAQRAGDVPLSFAQQRLWFVQQLDPDSSAYNLPEAIRLKGRLNAAALEEALNEICRRPENEKPSILLVVGHPAPDCRVPAAGGVKKPLAEITTWI